MKTNIYDIPYVNFPNPISRRDNFLLLDGKWNFTFSPSLQIPDAFDKCIIVPYSYETEASGIGDQSIHESFWYHREFMYEPNGSTLLHFLAVDYQCNVYVNRKFVGQHKGGFTSFYFDISEFIKCGLNEIHVRVSDSLNRSQIRGKQRARENSYECWYVQTSGIWKSVFLESAGTKYVTEAKIQANAEGEVDLKILLSDLTDVEIVVRDQNGRVVFQTMEKKVKHITKQFNIEEPIIWAIDNPVLYYVTVTTHSERKDVFHTYFGCRTITTNGGKLYINGQKAYLKLILNQGYHPQSGLSTFSKKQLVDDFFLIKEMGFNGCRIHQKIEDPLFYYLCDLYGLYLWSELPSAYHFDESMKQEVTDTLQDFVLQNYQSPSIITYVLFNESWGISGVNVNKEIQNFVTSLKPQVIELDQTRLIITNDGWFQTSNTDLASLHEYEGNHEKFASEYANKEYVLGEKIINGHGKAFAEGHRYQGQPILISEFGGISMQQQDGWGYGDKAEDIDSLISRFKQMINVVESLDYLSGYCYTQLTDVEQETNGLLYASRTPKFDLKTIKQIIESGSQL